MNGPNPRLAAFLTLASAICATACGSEVAEPSMPGDVAPDFALLAGTWTWMGREINVGAFTVTFYRDRTFSFVAEVMPASRPAGLISDACITTHTYEGFYRENGSLGKGSLTFTFTSGTANQITCNDPSGDSPGTPMDAEGTASLIEQGIFPPDRVTYTVTGATLLLTSSDTTHRGIGRGDGSSFTRTR